MKLRKIGVGEFATIYVRPAIASGVMYQILDLIIRARLGEREYASDLLLLSYMIVAGVILYPCLLFFIWKMAGSPPGAERLVIDTARRKIISIFKLRTGDTAAGGR